MKASSARRATSKGVKMVKQTERAKETAEAEAKRRTITWAEEKAPDVYAELEDRIKEACAKGGIGLQTSFGTGWRDWLTSHTIAEILKPRLKDDGYTVEECRASSYEFQGSDESPVETYWCVKVHLNWRKP